MLKLFLYLVILTVKNILYHIRIKFFTKKNIRIKFSVLMFLSFAYAMGGTEEAKGSDHVTKFTKII